MSALAKPLPQPDPRTPAASSGVHHPFLKYLPAVQTHAKIMFRHLPDTDREEAVAGATAAAFVNFHSANSRHKTEAIRPSTLARYAVLHVRDFRHVGGTRESTTDVMSHLAQRARGFSVERLPRDEGYAFDCLKAPDQPVWRRTLLEDRRTPVPDQAAFRVDWSAFLARQDDRTRQAGALLAAGYRRCEVADKLGVTASAVTQRMGRVERE